MMMCVDVEGDYRSSKRKSRDLPRGESHDCVNPADNRDNGSIGVLRDRDRVSSAAKTDDGDAERRRWCTGKIAFMAGLIL